MTYSIAYQMYSQLSVNVNLKKKEMRDNKTLLYFQKKLEKQYKEMTLFRNLKKEVETGANGTQDYIIKKGINKDKKAEKV